MIYPKFRFVLNDFYLLYYSLTRPHCRVPFLAWRKAVKKLRQRFPKGYAAIVNGLDHTWSVQLTNIASPRESSQWLHEREKEIEKLLQTGVRMPEFLQMRKETEAHLKEVKAEWKENAQHALIALQKITRIPIPSKTIEVIMVHPKLYGGFYLGGNPPKIIWGHDVEWPLYHTVYLCHEFLHALLMPDLSKWDYKEIDVNILHALIELATDNELRIRLYEKGRYFYVGKKYIGHDHLKLLVKNILSTWKRYLHSNESNLKGLAKKLTSELRGGLPPRFGRNHE